MERNPEAVCGTCPFWSGTMSILSAKCRYSHPEELAISEESMNDWTDTNHEWWCGEHPDFVLEESD